MNIRQILIAVSVSFLFNVGVAEAHSMSVSGHGKIAVWKHAVHHKLENLRHKKLHFALRHSAAKQVALKAPVAIKAPVKAPFFATAPSVNKTPSPVAPSIAHAPISQDSITTAPEISAASGASALAFLAGVMLMVGERTRNRKI
jgi:hypothetical protein